MRKLLVAASVGACLLVAAALAYAAGTTANTTMTIKTAVTPADSGTKRNPKDSKVSLEIGQKTKDGQGQPATSTAVGVDLAQEVIVNNLRFARRGQQCDEDEANRNKSNDGCPRSSIMGGGDVIAKGADGGLTVPLKLTAHILQPASSAAGAAQRRSPRLGLWIERDTPPQIRQFLPGTVNYRTRVLRFAIPPNVQSVAGVDTAIDTLDFVLRGKIRGRGALVQTIGCRKGRRTTKVTSFNKDGGRVSATHTARCRR